MNEFELVDLYRDWRGHYWVLIDFFVGVSFAVMAGFWLAGKYLKRTHAMSAVVTYSAFSIIHIWLIIEQNERFADIRDGLAALYPDGADVPAIVAPIISSSLGNLGPVVIAVYIAMWLATLVLAYLNSILGKR